jgi:hypothetical protein
MEQFAGHQSPVATDDAIIVSYPLPLARAWQRALIAATRPSFHHRQLLVAAETLTQYLGAVAIAAYEQYQSEGGAPNPTLNRSLRNLRRPTFGQWLGWVREALAAVPGGADLLPGLPAAYETAERESMLMLGYEGLRALMVVQLGYTGEYGPREAVSPRLMLELINAYQLRLVTHPPPPDSNFDEMAVVSVIAPALRLLYSRLGMIAGYPLLGLVQPAGQAAEVLRLQGLDPAASTVELDAEADPPGSLLLANPEELPMLVLDPWLIYGECPECGIVQVAAFAGQDGDTRHYHGLECEHSWTQSQDLALAVVEPLAAGAATDWTPGGMALDDEVASGAQAQLFAALEAESEALTAQRRAHRAADLSPQPSPNGAGEAGTVDHTRPGEVYLDLLDQRAAGGLTLDQLQNLDEQRAAAADDQRRADDPDPAR